MKEVIGQKGRAEIYIFSVLVSLINCHAVLSFCRTESEETHCRKLNYT